MSSLNVSHKKASKVAHRRLLLEPLERRDCPAVATLTVDTLLDENDGNTSAGNFSLREAVGMTRNLDTTFIKFAPGLTGTINLTLGELAPQRRTTISGPGANNLTIDAQNNSRIFNLVYRSFPDAFALEINISGMTLRNGRAANGYGGAIAIVGRTNDTSPNPYPLVSVRNCVIENNFATAGGGAVDVAYGTLNMQNCTLTNNSTSRKGGAISNYNGSLNIQNCTISGNQSDGEGGGIYSSLPLQNVIINTTITGNDANNLLGEIGATGGGLAGGSYLMQNSIVAGNKFQATSSDADISSAVIQRLSCNNIIGNSNTSGGLIDGVDGNIVGNNGTGTLNINTILNTNLAFNGGPTRTHALVAGSPAIDAGNNTVQFANIVALPSIDQRFQTRIVNGNPSGVATVDIGAFEVQPPTLQNASGDISFTEGAMATPLYPNATVKDPDSSNFNLGQLVVRFTANADPNDRLVIRAAGKFTVSGNQVSYDGKVFGTFTGGTGTTPLVVTFNANAITFAVRLLLNNTRFWNDSQNPSESPRTVFMQLTDASGGLSVPVTKQVDVTAINESPVLGGISGSVNYQQNAATAVTIAAAATLYDVDSPQLTTGTLTAEITSGGDASNRILIQGNGFTQSGQNILYQGTAIGTLNANGGVGATPFIVTFNSNSTPPIAQLLLRSLQFKTIGSTSTTARIISLSVSDGAGGVSATSTKSVNVVP